ncbi:MAG: DoxX family protein [Hyphomicrobiales bacterium]|nr:DoxX family protein [Hyphomicrobiales bacterium]
MPEASMNNPQISNAAALLGRVMLSAIFIMSGFNKIVGYAGTAAYMDKMGVPGMLLPLVILTELGGGLLILFGWQTRIVAFLMAGFTVLTGLLFHLKVGDAPNMIQFWKNIAIAGGFLALLTSGAGAWSLDGRGGKAA